MAAGKKHLTCRKCPKGTWRRTDKIGRVETYRCSRCGKTKTRVKKE